MEPSKRVLKIELFDSPSRVNGARLQARASVNGSTVQAVRVLTTSLWAKLFQDVQWYLEQYIYSDAYSHERASLVERDLHNACRRLAVDLDLDTILSQTFDTSYEDVEIQLVNQAEDLYDLAFAFPWELLEHTDIWSSSPRSVTVSRLIARETHVDDVERQVVDAQPNVNILLVLARALESYDGRPRDITPFVALEAITQLSNRYSGGRKLTVEVARPGTWSSVKKCLSDHPPGYYSLVHFDVHGRTRVGAPSLSFAGPDGSGKLKPEFVETVARALKKARVKNVVLNSCGSASNEKGADANPAHILLQHGITSVVGMSHRASSQAMSMFLRTFYETLVTGASFATATCVGRRTLSDSRSRRTNQQIDRDLSDYILPVLYTSEMSSAFLTLTEMELDDPAEAAPSTNDFYIDGRDFDVLKMENAVKRDNILRVIGDAGVGKSVLLRRATEIWEQTGLFSACVQINLVAEKVRNLGDFLRALEWSAKSKIPLSTSESSDEEVLVVIDNIQDAVALTGLEKQRHLSLLEWERIQKYLSKRPGRYILASRTNAIFTKRILDNSQVFELTGFHPLDSRMLLRREIGSLANQWPPEDHMSADLLLEMLQQNPTAIILVIPWIKAVGLGGHQFFEGLLNWSIDSEFQPYWASVAREQFKIPVLVDITRSFFQLDRCGQNTWLWLAFYWNHGPQYSTLSHLACGITPGATEPEKSVAHAIRVAEEHGYLVNSGEPAFIRNINPVWTVWIRYGILHGSRVLRDVENLHDMSSYLTIGNIQAMFGPGNPFKLTCEGPLLSFLPPDQQKSMVAAHGHFKLLYAGDFSDALVNFKDSEDAELKSLRTRQMRFNFLQCFNALMGSQAVIDAARMQFVELRLFWMLSRSVAGPHESTLHSRKIIDLMEHLTERMDLSGLEPFRVESAIGICTLPIHKASCTIDGIGLLERKLFSIAQKIWRTCEVRYGANLPPMIAFHSSFLEILSQRMDSKSNQDFAYELDTVKTAMTKAFDHFSRGEPETAKAMEETRDKYFTWMEKALSAAEDENRSNEINIESLRDSFEGLAPSHSIVFDNPMDSLSRDLANEKDSARWSDTLAQAVQSGDAVRACRVLKPMIEKSLAVYEWDNARQLLNIFWSMKPKHHSLTEEKIQEFVDLDAVTTLQWELEQASFHDTPTGNLMEAYDNMKRVHSFFKRGAKRSEETEEFATLYDKLMPIMETVLNTSTTKGYRDAQSKPLFKSAIKDMAELFESSEWVKSGKLSVGEAGPMLDSFEMAEGAHEKVSALWAQGKYAEAREALRLGTEKLIDLARYREKSLPFFYRHKDIPEEVVMWKDHFEKLTAYGVTAISLLEFVVARDTFGEALQVAQKLDGYSRSEQPIGWLASVRLTRSYWLEIQLLDRALHNDIPAAAGYCKQVLALLTAYDPDLAPVLTKKINFYKALNARFAAYLYSQQWEDLTNAFRPHEARLRLESLATALHELASETTGDIYFKNWSYRLFLSTITDTQLLVLEACGPSIGAQIWQKYRPPEDNRYTHDIFELADLFYFEGMMEMVAADID